jgi:hypothetical protein
VKNPREAKGTFVPEPGFKEGGNGFRDTSATKKFVAPEECFGTIVACRAVLKCRMHLVECIEMSGERHRMSISNRAFGSQFYLMFKK